MREGVIGKSLDDVHDKYTDSVESLVEMHKDSKVIIVKTSPIECVTEEYFKMHYDYEILNGVNTYEQPF